MYFIKKEISQACELACDESVIKNLSSAEKQAYGNTLISVIAEHKYPVGVLQATMCEEKKSLKERLVAIMNHNKKSGLIIIVSVILLGLIIFGALYLGAGVGIGKTTPPNIYINAEGEKAKVALMGSYSWENGSEHIQSDSDHPINFEYKLDNIVSVAGKEQLIIGTQKLKRDKQYDFTIEDIAVYKEDQLIEFETVEPSFMNGDLYIQAPSDAGEYIYTLRLNFKDRGTVSYGFIVRVNMLTYNLAEISKFKTPYVGAISKVSAIVSHLPVPHNYFKQKYISMETSNKPYSLTIYYEPALNIEYEGEYPIVTPNCRANALVVFSMIDNLDEISFAFCNSQSDGELDESKYDTTYTFQRTSFEKIYGDLSVLRDNLHLLQDTLAGKIDETKETTNIVVSISSSIDEYTPAMSSVPGLPLTVNISGEDEQSNIVYIWKAEEGIFLSWKSSDGIVNTLGNECTIEDSTIYWSPYFETKENKDTFKITVEVKNNESEVIIGQKTIEIDCSKEFRYSILK